MTDTQADTAPPALGDVVAGFTLIITTLIVSASSVVIAESFLLNHVTAETVTTGSVLTILGIMTGVAVGVVVCFIVTSGVANVFGDPFIAGWTEYTLAGWSGIAGVTAVTVSSILIAVTGVGSGAIPGVMGESMAAAIVAAVPVSGVYYAVTSPSRSHLSSRASSSASVLSGVRDGSSSSSDSSILDPEVVRERTERGTVDDVTHPAYPGGSRADRSNTANDRGSSDSSSAGDSSTSVDPSELQFNWQTETDVSFDDIGGMNALKDELKGDVIRPLEEKERAAELGITAPNIVFWGPPGTGKTFTAEALATELDLPFVMLSGADVTSKWINESSQKVNDLFSEAKTVAAQEGGAVVFLDELDTVLKNRESAGSSHEEDNKVVNEFLNHLEDTKDHDIVFIGATNRLDSLDEAGIRSGRIDKKIEVGKPDRDARAAILQQKLDERKHTVSESEVDSVAASTDGRVAADMEALVKKAATRVFNDERDTIEFRDLKYALKNTDW